MVGGNDTLKDGLVLPVMNRAHQLRHVYEIRPRKDRRDRRVERVEDTRYRLSHQANPGMLRVGCSNSKARFGMANPEGVVTVSESGAPNVGR